MWLERLLLALALAVLVTAPLAFGATRPVPFLAVRWLVFAMAAVWIVRLGLNRGIGFSLPVNGAFLLLFVAYAGVRFLTTDVVYVAREEWIRILVYGLFFFCIVNNLNRPVHGRLVTLTLLVLGAVISCYAIYQYATDHEFIWNVAKPDQYVHRGSGTYINPNHLAGLLAMLLPLGVGLVATGWFRPLTRITLAYLLVVIGGGLYVTVSRGGWMACGAGLGALFYWWAWRSKRHLTAWLLLSVLMAAPIFLIVKSQVSRDRVSGVGWLGQFQDVRRILWPAAFRMWQDHWFCGVGLAQFDVHFPRYRPAHRDLQVQPQRTHNDYLNLLVDWGVIGGVLMGGVWVSFFWATWKRWPRVLAAEEDPVTFNQCPIGFVAGAAFALVAILVHSLLDFNLNIPANALVAVALMALVSGAYGCGPRRMLSPGLRRLSRGVGWLVLVVSAAYLLATNIHMSREQKALGVATADEDVGYDALIRVYQEAHQVEPLNPLTCYKIAELYRQRSWQGLEGYRQDALTAIAWYRQASALNPYDAYNLVGHAMCLDWLGQREEAERLFTEANRLDPNGYVTCAMIGWHYLSAEENAEAVRWLERSTTLYSNNNFLAWYYLQRAKERLAQEERVAGRMKSP